jgi:hypothetical protein
MRPWLKAMVDKVAHSKPVQELGAELKRLGAQGSTELMSGLYQGNAFTPYGVGQDRDRFNKRDGRDM